MKKNWKTLCASIDDAFTLSLKGSKSEQSFYDPSSLFEWIQPLSLQQQYQLRDDEKEILLILPLIYYYSFKKLEDWIFYSHGKDDSNELLLKLNLLFQHLSHYNKLILYSADEVQNDEYSSVSVPSSSLSFIHILQWFNYLLQSLYNIIKRIRKEYSPIVKKGSFSKDFLIEFIFKFVNYILIFFDYFFNGIKNLIDLPSACSKSKSTFLSNKHLNVEKKRKLTKSGKNSYSSPNYDNHVNEETSSKNDDKDNGCNDQDHLLLVNNQLLLFFFIKTLSQLMKLMKEFNINFDVHNDGKDKNSITESIFQLLSSLLSLPSGKPTKNSLYYDFESDSSWPLYFMIHLAKFIKNLKPLYQNEKKYKVWVIVLEFLVKMIKSSDPFFVEQVGDDGDHHFPKLDISSLFVFPDPSQWTKNESNKFRQIGALYLLIYLIEEANQILNEDSDPLFEVSESLYILYDQVLLKSSLTCSTENDDVGETYIDSDTNFHVRLDYPINWLRLYAYYSDRLLFDFTLALLRHYKGLKKYIIKSSILVSSGKTLNLNSFIIYFYPHAIYDLFIDICTKWDHLLFLDWLIVENYDNFLEYLITYYNWSLENPLFDDRIDTCHLDSFLEKYFHGDKIDNLFSFHSKLYKSLTISKSSSPDKLAYLNPLLRKLSLYMNTILPSYERRHQS